MCPASRSPLHLYNLIINQASHFTSFCVSKTAESDWEIYFKLSSQNSQKLFLYRVEICKAWKFFCCSPKQTSCVKTTLKEVKLLFFLSVHMLAHWYPAPEPYPGGPQFNLQLRREPMPSLQCPRSAILQRPSLKQVHL